MVVIILYICFCKNKKRCSSAVQINTYLSQDRMLMLPFFPGQEIELTMHDGTVRDMCFIEDSSNKSSLLISGGAGDCKIYVTDCATGTPFQALSGHTGAAKIYVVCFVLFCFVLRLK